MKKPRLCTLRLLFAYAGRALDRGYERGRDFRFAFPVAGLARSRAGSFGGVETGKSGHVVIGRHQPGLRCRITGAGVARKIGRLCPPLGLTRSRARYYHFPFPK